MIFLKEDEEIKVKKSNFNVVYGCVMMDFPNQLASYIKSFIRSEIPEDIIFNDSSKIYGIPKDIHITVKYGLHDIDFNEIKNLIKKFDIKSIPIILRGISFFDNERFCVAKVDVESEELIKFNKIICENLVCTDTFNEYCPHLTLAYIKKGTSEKIKNLDYFEGMKVTLNKLVFSTPVLNKKFEMEI